MRLFKKKRPTAAMKRRSNSDSPQRGSGALHNPFRIEIPAPLSSPNLIPEAPDLAAMAPFLSQAHHASSRYPGDVTLDIFHGPFPLQNRLSEPLVPRIVRQTQDANSTNDFVRFLVGKQDPTSRYLTPQLFVLPTSSLVQSKLLSNYAAYSEKANGSNSLIRLEDLDPSAFLLYVEYLSTGEFVFEREEEEQGCNTENSWSWPACWPLINAHIMATTLGDDQFADYVMGVLTEKLDRRQFADIETIQRVFTTVDGSDELKCLIVDHAVLGGARNFGRGPLELYPSSFIYMALQKTVERLSSTKDTSDRSRSETRYSPQEFCIARRDVRKASLKGLRERLIVVARTRRAEAMEAELRANGVNTIDWAFQPLKDRVKQSTPQKSSLDYPNKSPHMCSDRENVPVSDKLSSANGRFAEKKTSITAPGFYFHCHRGRAKETSRSDNQPKPELMRIATYILNRRYELGALRKAKEMGKRSECGISESISLNISAAPQSATLNRATDEVDVKKGKSEEQASETSTSKPTTPDLAVVPSPPVLKHTTDDQTEELKDPNDALEKYSPSSESLWRMSSTELKDTLERAFNKHMPGAYPESTVGN